jgi:Glycosyl-transferase family 4
MENSNIHASVDRQKPIRANFNSKSNLSGRNGPKKSGTIKRLNPASIRSARRESKGSIGQIQRFKSNRLVLYLGIIALWTYIGFHVQSKWAHNDHGKSELSGYNSQASNSTVQSFEEEDSDIIETRTKSLATEEKEDEPNLSNLKPHSLELNLDSNKTNFEDLATERRDAESNISNMNFQEKKKTMSEQKSRKGKKVVVEKDPNSEFEDGLVPRKNTSYGLIVGPFARTEDAVLEWNSDKRRGTCDRNGEFAKLVFSRSFVLVFHELSMTGAPISMMELASELLSCGARVSVVVVNRKGGLLTELQKRGIKVLKDRMEASFKVAMKADAVIAGSAVCSTWIG